MFEATVALTEYLVFFLCQHVSRESIGVELVDMNEKTICLILCINR